ncbi:MAG: cofactor-independent phosphoglycerate mutase [Nitrospiraceae bacterium]|nr:MAG: cofactor-independent phosphoglycerate mutase [Nitrospiraceae bacterium]
MKFVVLVGDGMADRPLKKLGYRTCLQAARTPNMDRLAREGERGIARTIPRGFDPGSDVANLSILGYAPAKYYSGRAPLEAAYRGIELGPSDVAFRCNLVTLNFGDSGSREAAVMDDYSAGHITSKEAGSIIRDIHRKLGGKDVSFYPGVSYRHLMVWRKGNEKIRCTPPHDITGRKIGDHLPRGRGADILLKIMDQAQQVLLSHPVNRSRRKRGLREANSLWFWGQGKKSAMPRFADKYGLSGALISAVDLTKGLGMCSGFEIINVKGATGYIDTNYEGKARAALRALRKHDLVYVHVEAPDEAGHQGDLKAKIQAIEDFDAKVVGPIAEGMKRFGEYSILLMPDHATPLSVMTHTDEPVPFVIFRSRQSQGKERGRACAYSEAIARMKGIRVFEKGHELMNYFIRGRRGAVAP